MTAISRIKLGLAVCSVLVAAGCAGKQDTAQTVQDPEVPVSCIGVLPVHSAVDMDETLSQAEIRVLKEGGQVMDGVLKGVLGGKGNVQFVTSQQLTVVSGGEGLMSLENARQVASQLGCNALMETTLSRFEDRVGGQYGVKQPAAVTFEYKLYEVGEGKVLCHGRFDEQQKSVMENLLTFNTASSRGFTWVTAEELAREGVKERLGQCSYFADK